MSENFPTQYFDELITKEKVNTVCKINHTGFTGFLWLAEKKDLQVYKMLFFQVENKKN